MAEFNLAAVLGEVSRMDTGVQPGGREQIEYIDISLIDPDPNNFYEMSGIDDLAANIELLGIQQPLRVRNDGDKPGRVMIVSGHRRLAALNLLVDEGKTQYAMVPCIRETAAGSAALQELRLIYANSDTRRMSSAEIAKQAERVEALLYQLKEEGMEFPGRMRDHVAEACKISRSKLARLSVIRKSLAAEFVPHYKNGELPETTAYVLAQQPAEIQQAVLDYKCHSKENIKALRGWEIDSFATMYTAIAEQRCEMCNGGRCEHSTVLLERIYADRGRLSQCEFERCCNKCNNLPSCKTACPKLEEKAAKLRADKKETARQEKLGADVRERQAVEQITALWQRFGHARQQARKSVEEYKRETNMLYCGDVDDEKYHALEAAQCKVVANMSLPYANSLYEIKRLIRAADCLGCSVDYLLCRTDVPEVNKGGTSLANPASDAGLPED